MILYEPVENTSQVFLFWGGNFHAELKKMVLRIFLKKEPAFPERNAGITKSSLLTLTIKINRMILQGPDLMRKTAYPVNCYTKFCLTLKYGEKDTCFRSLFNYSQVF